MKPFSSLPEEITYSEWKRKLLKPNRPFVCEANVCYVLCVYYSFFFELQRWKEANNKLGNLSQRKNTKLYECMSWRLDRTDMLFFIQFYCSVVYLRACVSVCVSVCLYMSPTAIRKSEFLMFSLSSKSHNNPSAGV